MLSGRLIGLNVRLPGIMPRANPKIACNTPLPNFSGQCVQLFGVACAHMVKYRNRRSSIDLKADVHIAVRSTESLEPKKNC